MDITFNLMFSSLSPGRINLFSSFAQHLSLAPNATERQKQRAHDGWEQWCELSYAYSWQVVDLDT